jgi:cytochrome c5
MRNAIIAVATILFLSAGFAQAQDAPPKTASDAGTVHSITLPNIQVSLKEGDGRPNTEAHCNVCHSTDYITMQPKFSKAQWTATVTKMIKVFGAPIPQEDADTIINYLATSYGTGK